MLYQNKNYLVTYNGGKYLVINRNTEALEATEDTQVKAMVTAQLWDAGINRVNDLPEKSEKGPNVGGPNVVTFGPKVEDRTE
jgi:hypothetical protein